MSKSLSAQGSNSTSTAKSVGFNTACTSAETSLYCVLCRASCRVPSSNLGPLPVLIARISVVKKLVS